jgi:hypothetical protein
MKLEIAHKSSYSRGQLLLRTFFGWIYIGIPHGFLLFFHTIWASILGVITFWIVLFTGKYPRNWFDYQVALQRWSLRVSAALYNLTDESPSFGTDGKSETVSYDVEYPASLSRGKVLLRMFFGWAYIFIPHGIALYFRFLVTLLFIGIAWWVVLLTGSYPKGLFDFNVGTFRWANRLSLYWGLFTDEYPPFSGK